MALTPEELADLDRRIDEALASVGCESRQRCGVLGVAKPGSMTMPAGYIDESGVLSCVHVTDDPSPVVEALQTGQPLTDTYERVVKGRMAELGPGLYCSNAPELWMGRSRRKWEFLDRLTREQRERIAQAVLNHPHMTWPDYLTPSEKEIARRDLENFVETGHGGFLVGLAGQPYNIPVWKPEFLEPLGIKPGPQPQTVPVEADGPIARVQAPITREVAEALQRAGFTGACDPGSLMGGYPQCVIWHNKAVRRFGDYTRPGSENRA